jgi:hypothetical protein
VPTGAHSAELACPLERETALVNKVVNAGLPVIAMKEVERDNISLYNPGGTAERRESFVPEWMKDFLFLDGGQ